MNLPVCKKAIEYRSCNATGIKRKYVEEEISIPPGAYTNEFKPGFLLYSGLGNFNPEFESKGDLYVKLIVKLDDSRPNYEIKENDLIVDYFVSVSQVKYF